jgi:hypothetical protein
MGLVKMFAGCKYFRLTGRARIIDGPKELFLVEVIVCNAHFDEVDWWINIEKLTAKEQDFYRMMRQ